MPDFLETFYPTSKILHFSRQIRGIKLRNLAKITKFYAFELLFFEI